MFTSRPVILLLWFACLLRLASEGLAAAPPRESVGYVLNSTGDWLQDGVKFPHKSGDPVYSGAVITLDPAYKDTEITGASIVVTLFNGKREERSSHDAASFAQPITLPKSLGEQTSGVGRLMRAMSGLFASHPDEYVIATVRGVPQFRLHEAVVKLDGDKVDLTPVFKDAPPDNYHVTFRSVSTNSSGQDDENSEPISFQWSASNAQPFVAPSLRLGIWQISLVRDDGLPLGADAWMLVCRPGEYDAAAKTFSEAEAVTTSWGKESGGGKDSRTFLRTALDAIAHGALK